MIEFDVHTLSLIMLIYLMGGVVKGVLGFGLPIMTMALLPFVVSIEQAIVLSAIVQPATNVFQLFSAGGLKRAVELATPVLLTLLPGIILGAWLLSMLDGGLVLVVVGMTISVYALYDLAGLAVRIPDATRFPAGLGFGFVAGIFGALTSVNGWAFIIYLLGCGASRNEFRSAIALLFLVSGFLISSSFYAVGLLTQSLFLCGLLALVPSFSGMWLGGLLGKRIPAETFRQIVLVALVGVGFVLAYRGLGSIRQG